MLAHIVYHQLSDATESHESEQNHQGSKSSYRRNGQEKALGTLTLKGQGEETEKTRDWEEETSKEGRKSRAGSPETRWRKYFMEDVMDGFTFWQLAE